MATVGIFAPVNVYDVEETRLREQVYGRYMPAGVNFVTVTDERNSVMLAAQSDFDRLMANIPSFFASLDTSGMDVIIYSGAIHPGLYEARSECAVPIVGPGEAALFVGSVLGLPTSILSINEQSTAMTYPFLDRLAAKPEIVSIVTSDFAVVDLVGDRGGAADAMVAAAKKAKADGARAVMYGSMTLGTLEVSHRITEETGLVVLDPLQISATTAHDICRARGVL